MNKSEIKKGLENSFSEITSWLKNQDDLKFDQGPPGKWNTSQQLDHIYKSTKAINKGMSFPKLILRWKFGVANRESRSWDALNAKYKTAIANIPKDFKQPAAPKSYGPENKSLRVQKFENIGKQHIEMLNTFSEKQLDKFILPHPAIGKCTFREFFMWTIIHNDHHFSFLRKDY